MTTAADQFATPERERLRALLERERTTLLTRQPRSSALLRRSARVIPGGVTSSWHTQRPEPMWVVRGRGARVWDVDGNEFRDFHLGYGAVVAGHGNEAVVAAASARLADGTQFAQPTPVAVDVAEELVRRFGLPLWRFNNSGTEATMDAVRLMRAVTGRPRIVKLEGTYDGHYDSLFVSVYPDHALVGPRQRPHVVPGTAGIPNEIAALTAVVSWNDPDVVEALFGEEGDQIVGIVIEPVNTRYGIVPSRDFITGLIETAHRHGAFVTFDEVKTGLTIAPGGATQHYGVTPDLICLGKALGGGVPCGAVGGTEPVMDAIRSGAYQQVGTFSANALTMAAAAAVLTKVLTPATHRRLADLSDRLATGLARVVHEFALPAHVVGIGARGCVIFAPGPIRDYRDAAAIDGELEELFWVYQHNRGVWQWITTWCMCVDHDEEDVNTMVENFHALAREIRG